MHPSADPSVIEAALKSAFQQADEEIIERAERQGTRYGTTAVCALFWGSKLHVAHAGDSRAVLCREDKAVRLTKDHKPASNPAERERIEALGEMLYIFALYMYFSLSSTFCYKPFFGADYRIWHLNFLPHFLFFLSSRWHYCVQR